MKKIATLLLFFFSTLLANAQVAGDTIVVSTFNYGSTVRDSVVQFPNQAGLTFEKIIMQYSMRCKNGLVSTGSNTNLGCGEWDYSCNTYITDSTKTDSAKATYPSHIIPGFAGTTFNYTNLPTYTYYQYTQQNVIYNSIISETASTVGTATTTSASPLNTSLKSSKSQFVWTATELTTAGLVAGNISSIRVNVSNAGSTANFLKIKMKHTTASTLSSSTPDLTGFTEVYFLNTTLVNGINQFNFYNNFAWNGTDNILVEFSFTNTTNGTNTLLQSDNTPTVTGLVTASTDYSYNFTGVNNFKLNNTNFGSINSEVTVSFWSNGNPDFLPTNTSAFHANTATGARQLNAHLPWSNSNVYWDAGNNGTYDRISNVANINDFEGKWNHWTFTKNATTGIMNIYLNGALWLSGTGKTMPMAVTQFILGSGYNNNNLYFGKMDEFTIWNSELSQATIQNWMYKDIDATHPNYSNLLAYYKFNEGTGTNCNDNVTTSSTTISSPMWNTYNGNSLFKGFTETTNRPIVTFVQGTYNQTTTTISVLDSMQNIPYTVYSFSTNGVAISPVDTQQHYKAGFVFKYDGETGALLDSVSVASTNTITITQLNYYVFSPSNFQIMSFVTPYGINLDLGPNGKTWTFDVTDFTPILKGNKRIYMDAGGQFQENIDIKFLFIVGTPPRNVVDINNIWKVESVPYANILNDNKFEPRTILMNPTASMYKVRSAITGHGQEGEFIQQTHYINVNNATTPQYSWDVWKQCGENPVYPQGGTWVYDRAGWCPGMATDLKEMNVTPYVTPNVNAIFNYGISSAVSGASNYWVSNQLVSYGVANFALDAAIIDIKNPSSKIEDARSNSICANPKIVIRNTGSTTLTKVDIDYWVNNNTTHLTHTWNGSLAFLDTVEITMPSNDVLWGALNGTSTGNVFYAEIKSINGGADSYSYNNKMKSDVNLTSIMPADFYIYFKSNNNASENDYKVVNEWGQTIFARNGMSNNTIYKDTLHLPVGCYTFILTDAGNDGINFWANTAQGSGMARFYRTTGSIIKNLQGDFGHSLVTNFTVDFPLSYNEIFKEEAIAIYPNPSSSNFTIELFGIENYKLNVVNQLGQQLNVPVVSSLKNKTVIDGSHLTTGIYFVQIVNNEGKTITKKIVKE